MVSFLAYREVGIDGSSLLFLIYKLLCLKEYMRMAGA